MYSYKVCLLRCYPDQLPIRWFHVKGLPFVVQGKHTNKASVPNFMKIYWKLVRSNFPRNSKDATGHSIQQIWSKNPNDAFLVSHVCYSSRSFILNVPWVPKFILFLCNSPHYLREVADRKLQGSCSCTSKAAHRYMKYFENVLFTLTRAYSGSWISVYRNM